MKTVEELKAIIADSKNWKAQHEAFGTHLPKAADAEALSEVATKMIVRCNIWKAHWEIIQSDIKPELDRIREKNLTDKAKSFVDYDDEQWGRLCAERARLRGEAVPVVEAPAAE